MLTQLARMADLFNAAPIENRDAIRHLHRFRLIVRNKDRGETRAVVNFSQPFAQVLANFGVQGAKRLVKQ